MKVLYAEQQANQKSISNFTGALMGLQAGDALGMPAQGWMRHDIKEQFGVLSSMKRGMLVKGDHTDDTEMAFSVAEALWKTKSFNGSIIAKTMVDNYSSKRGYERCAVKSFELIAADFGWMESGQSSFYANKSYGNSSAARSVPLALIYSTNMNDLLRYSIMLARITHVHPLALEGTKLFACAIGFIMRQVDAGQSVEPESLIDFLEMKSEESEYKDKLRLIRKFLRSKPEVGEVAEFLGSSYEAINSIPTALYAFLAHLDSFKKAVIYAVNLGGVTDSLGSLTGALAGAYHGEENIPDSWRRCLRDKGKAARIHGKRMYKLWSSQQMLSNGTMSRKLSRM
ncbi:MAG: ADP-ribosylglycohydrolase family protein [Candidatus Auribacterota bacterium]